MRKSSSPGPRKLCRVIPLSQYVTENLGISPAQGKKLRRDPEFPPLLLIGVNRFGVREDDGAAYQEILERRAKVPRQMPSGIIDARKGAAASAKKRRANAAARRARAES